MLRKHGWRKVGMREGVGLWRRPGKAFGISATTNYGGARHFYVFSTNAAPFEPETSYSPLGVYATLEHGGDYKAAARALKSPPPVPPILEGEIRPGNRMPNSSCGAGAPYPAILSPLPAREGLGVGSPLTDLGNAERLAAVHGEDLRYCHRWGSWLIWDGMRWRRDETGEILRRAKRTVRRLYAEAARLDDDDRRKALAKHARASEARSRLEAMVALAQSEPGMPVTVEELDADPWALNCRNGTLDLRTGRLRPHDRKDMIAKLAAVTYRPDAPCPLWEAFLERVLPDAGVREFLRRAVGYSLTGSVAAQCLFFLYGKGANGKSTFINTLLTLLGDYGMQAAPDILVSRDKGGGGPSSEIAGLVGARLVATTEVDDGRRLAEGLVKQITGGDRIRARFLHQEFFEFSPTHKLWLSANHKPVVRGGDEGIWRRIKLVPFEVTIPPEERDEGLGDRLLGELPGILAWAVRGCLEWLEQGHARGLGEPDAVRNATDAYRSEMDVLSAFLEERCVIRPALKVTCGELYTAYLKWCEENGDRPLGRRSFGGRLQEQHGVAPGSGVGAKKARGWIGVGLVHGDVSDVGDVNSPKFGDEISSYSRSGIYVTNVTNVTTANLAE